MNVIDERILTQRLERFPGDYECHMTIELEPKQLKTFTRVCSELDANALIINLNNGRTPRQPMLAKVIRGSTEEVTLQIKTIYRRLSDHFKIIRLKVETHLKCQTIPKSNADAMLLPMDCYFEFHTRLKLPIDQNIGSLKQKAKRFSGHLSNNALSKNRGFQYRFITQRFRSLGKENAENELDELLMFLESEQLTVDKVIREFNIYDSNSSLDSGWAND